MLASDRWACGPGSIFDSRLAPRVFPRVLRFSSPLKNQHVQIHILLEQEPAWNQLGLMWLLPLWILNAMLVYADCAYFVPLSSLEAFWVSLLCVCETNVYNNWVCFSTGSKSCEEFCSAGRKWRWNWNDMTFPIHCFRLLPGFSFALHLLSYHHIEKEKPH